MSDVRSREELDPAAPDGAPHNDPRNGGRHVRQRSRSRLAVISTVVVLAAAAAFTVVQFIGDGTGKTEPGKTGPGKANAAGNDEAKATVISTDGATVDGRTINGALYIKANNVHVVNTTVHHQGTLAIRIFDGFNGTVIQNTRVFCDAPTTDGIGYGNYTATKVEVHGCADGFVSSAAVPVLVTNSTWNDKPYTVNYAFTEPGKKHATTGAGLVPGQVTSPLPGAKPWPGPTSTGVPAGTALTPYTGKYSITEPNTVIDGKILTDCLDIKAKDVIIRRSKITCKNKGGMIIRVFDEMTADASITVEDSEIVGDGEGLGIGFGHFTMRRVDMHNLNEGVRVSDGALIEDSWIHDLVFTDEKDHQDILQTTGGTGMVVRHNSLEAFDPTTDEPFNAGFQVGSETAPSVTNLLVEDNLFTGGNYTVNFRPDIKANQIHFRNNVFVRNSRYGASSNEDLKGIIWDPTNVYLDNGKAVTVP